MENAYDIILEKSEYKIDLKCVKTILEKNRRKQAKLLNSGCIGVMGLYVPFFFLLLNIADAVFKFSMRNHFIPIKFLFYSYILSI